ncbi:PREDICTED: ADP-ribose pyrophosphatase, mitochondrial isoform X3 [Papilio polytes]|uniref:ADP-ribose pyrophosphatase, mitochondrial isoform X3 n=1 Tax=Papilio polytes TaxID=76194 RepID=UPI000675F907|nr:PREDICTED: ADP-ribose pyrophosphatase, mitochondrial isoform X3 [Papilio polytes]
MNSGAVSWIGRLNFGIVMILQHVKARCPVYPRTQIKKFTVPDDKVLWTVEYKEYKPRFYTAPSVYGKPWADPDIDDLKFKPTWNSIDGNVNRKSYVGNYSIKNGFPMNPVGRTGIYGRGLLGRWGPNHAADPVVTRWKKQADGENAIDEITKKPILQFVAIKRGDTGEWALPGGMVDPGEKVGVTAVREFQEEAMNSLSATDEEKSQWNQQLKYFFSKGVEVYSGYVDDPRNTDNAWLETVAYNFHDHDGSTVGGLKLNAGDDAVGVCWVDITPNIELYASHKDIVSEVYKRLLK